MPKYYVSKWRDLVYIQDEDSWTTIRSDGQMSTEDGTMPADLVTRAREIDSAEAFCLIEQRRAESSHGLEAERQNKGWFSGRSTRTRALVVLGLLLVVCGALAFVIGWEIHVSDPLYKYHQVGWGMAYDEVVHIMGDSGKYDHDSSGDQVYVWSREGGMLLIHITFHDDRVTYKGIMNWEI